MTTLYHYEVELKLTEKATGAARLVTRQEHAYSVHDAVMQALFNAGVDLPADTYRFELVRVGPPLAAIAAAADDLAAKVTQTMAGLVELTRQLVEPKEGR